MSTVYGENGLAGTGYTPPKRVNFGWLGESWSLFRENAGLWIFAILIGFYGPIIFDGFIVFAQSVSLGIARRIGGTGGVIHGTDAVLHGMPHGLLAGVIILDIVFSAYIWSGIFRMAVKQVSGEPINFSDIFGGARNFGSMLVFLVIAAILIWGGSLFVLLPGIFAAALLLPGYALVASGEPVGSAISRSMSAMLNDRYTGMAFVFGLGAIIALSSLVFGAGELVTLPMFALISALAYRDMIGLPHSGKVESLDAILGLDAHARPAVSLTGESEEAGNGTSAP